MSCRTRFRCGAKVSSPDDPIWTGISRTSEPSLPRHSVRLLRSQSHCGLQAGFCVLESPSRLEYLLLISLSRFYLRSLRRILVHEFFNLTGVIPCPKSRPTNNKKSKFQNPSCTNVPLSWRAYANNSFKSSNSFRTSFCKEEKKSSKHIKPYILPVCT